MGEDRDWTKVSNKAKELTEITDRLVTGLGASALIFVFSFDACAHALVQMLPVENSPCLHECVKSIAYRLSVFLTGVVLWATLFGVGSYEDTKDTKDD